MSPVPPPPPPVPPTQSSQVAPGYVSRSQISASLLSSTGAPGTEAAVYSVAPPQPHPELYICIADSSETAQIFRLPGIERDETIKRLEDECLTQLGVTISDKGPITTRTSTNRESELVLIITFLNLVLLTVTKVTESIKDVTDNASAWAKFFTNLPDVWLIIRRAAGLGRKVTYNEPMLIGLTINYARSSGPGNGVPVDFCFMKPIASITTGRGLSHKDSNLCYLLTCDELPHPKSFFGFIVDRAGHLLAHGKTSRTRSDAEDSRFLSHLIQPFRSSSAPGYEVLRTAADVAETELDIEHITEIAAILVSSDAGDIRRLKIGILSRVHGTTFLWPGKRALTEIDNWPPMTMNILPHSTSLIELTANGGGPFGSRPPEALGESGA